MSRGSRCAGPLALAAIVAVGWLAWSNTLQNGFVYDDEIIIVKNAAIRSLSPLSKFLRPDAQYDGALESRHTWRPLSVLSHAVIYRWAGLDPRAYHLSNVLLHVANALLAYALILVLFRSRTTALVAALVFLLHPGQTEAVAWASAQSNLLYVFFYLSASILFVRSEGRVWSPAFALSLACFGLSLLSKESAVSLPLALGLCLVMARVSGKDGKQAGLASLVPYIVLAGVYVLARSLTLGKTAQTGYWAGGLLPQMLTMAKGFATYVRIAVWPDPLTLEYLFPVKRALDAETLGCGILLAGLACLGWRCLRRQPQAGFGILFFFLALAPVSNVIPINTVINERYLYLPLLGYGLVLGALLERGLKAGLPAFAALCGLFVILTASRNLDWKDNRTLIGETLKICPQASRLHSGMADALSQDGRFKEAVKEYRLALAIEVFNDPLLRTIDRFDPWEPGVLSKVAEYRKSLQLAVKRDKTLSNIGAALMRLGEHRKAARYLEEAVRLGASGQDTRTNLAVAHAQEGELSRAVVELEVLLKEYPGDRKALHNLALFREARVASFIPRLKQEFPSLKSKWESLSRLGYEETPGGLRPSLLGPVQGLKPEERQALAALAVREGRVLNDGSVLPKRYGEAYSVRFGDSAVRIRPIGGFAAESRVVDGVVLYPDAYQETSVFLAASGSSVEEFYYLKTPEAPRRFVQEFEGEGRIRSFSLTAEGNVAALNAVGAKVLELSKPVVIDSAGRKRGGVFSLKRAGAKTLLALAFDDRGLEFPVVIDPTWTTAGASQMTSARYAHSATLLPSGKVLVAGGFGGGYLPTAELYDPVAGTWTTTGSMPVARYKHTATLLPNGKVLVVGGSNGGGYLSTAALYDPATGTWATTSSMSTARESHVAALLSDGQVLVAGGFITGPGYLSTAEVYDPFAGTWTTTGSMVEARAEHAATLLRNGKLLAAGGYNGNCLSTAELYDPVAGTWTTTGSMAGVRREQIATLLPNGKVLAAGGTNAGGGSLSTAELYDPVAGTWTMTGAMVSARGYHVAALLPGGKVLVAGGYSGGYLSTAELYDPVAGTWTTIGSLSNGSEYHTATLLPNGKVLVAGGLTVGSLALSTAQLYAPALGSWASTGNMVSTRREHAAALLPNGKVLVAGGNNCLGCYFATAELYAPVVGAWAATGGMTAARDRLTVTLLPNGKVLAAGGSTGSFHSSAELYDPAAGTWAPTGSMPSVRIEHTATLLPNGKVLVAAGWNGDYVSTAVLYDPNAGSWAPTGSLAEPRYGHTATLLPNGKVLVAGGNWSSGNTAELYDPVTGSWAPTGSMNSVRRWHTATLLSNGKVLVAGGGYSTSISGAEVYDPAAGTWTPTGSMTSARRFHSAVLLPDGKVLAAGGFDGGTLSAMELYDPAAGTWAAAGSMVWPRSLYTATLLPDGKVLAAAGSSASPYSSTAELVQYTEYDFDLSTKTFMRPGIATVNGIGSFPVTLNPGNVYTVTGTTFTGVAEAAGSGRSGGDSTANHPRVYLMPQGSGGYGPGLPQGGLVDLSTSVYGNQEQTYYQQGKSSTTLDFTVPAGLACGYYNLHVMSNAILSTGAAVRIVPPVPTIAPSAASPGFLSVGLSSVAVQWTPTAESGVTGYIVQTALDAGFTNIVSTGFTTQALVPAATVYGLVPNTTYYFRAAAENCGGYGPFSGSLGSTSTLVAQPGTAISTFSAVRFGRMSVSWTANGNLVDATTYTVVLTTGASFPNAYDGNVSLSTLPAGVSLSATVTGLAPDALYFLHVAAVNHNGVASPYIALASTRTLGGPGCGPNSTVVQQDGYGDSTTIQGGVNLLPQTLTSDACVMIRDLGTYSEQVAVQSFTTSGYRLKIMTDPGFGPERAKVTPPALQGAFIVRNASVTIQGIDVVSANSTPYGIYASSSFVTISSVGVKGGSFISSAGIMLSSNSRVEFTSVTVQDAHGIAVMGSTSTIAMSTMTNSALTSYALFLMDGSSNSVSASYVANALGSGASIRSSHRNTVSLSTVTGSGSTGAFYINGGLSSAGASSNTVSECYVFGPASHGMYIDGRGGGSSNQVVKSTVVGNGAANVGMYVYWTFGNVVSGSRISNPTGGGVEITVSAHHNNFSSCTAISGGGYSAMSFYMASSNTVSGSYLLASSGKALSIRTTSKSNEIRESTLESSGPIDPALYLYDDAQSNTITNSFISNTGGGRAVDVALNSHHNTISLSTVTNNSASYPAVWVTNAGASSNTISECSIHNPSGIAAKLGTSAQFNIVEKSTISSNAAGAGGLAALDLDGASWNEVRRNRLQSASSKALALRGNATGNTVRLNTISGGLVDGSAVYLNAALSNLLDEDKITNVVGIGILLETGSRFNEVRNSTVTAAGDAFFAQSSSSNTIFGSYLEGGNAARVADSSGTRIYSSYLVSAANGGGGLLYEGGSLNLEVSSSTLIGRQGYGFMMGSGSGGRVVLSTNTIEGLTHGVEIIGPHRSGTEIWLASNTVVSDVWGSGSVYGVYLEGLTSGATVYNNSIVRRTPGGAAGYTAYGIYALNSPKLRVANNRISNPGLAANGSFVGAHFEASADAEFVFNDVSSSGTALAGSSLLRFVNSTGGKVRNNILFSSVTVSGSSSTLSVNAVSQGGFISDYNDFFCANGPCITDWGGLRYGGLGAWQTVAGQDSHSRAKDPLWFSPGTGSEDFHPLSAGGRWNPATQGWQIDAVVSRTIDGGDPADPFGDEPAPNGGRVNLGSYGNTLEASKYAPWTYDRHLVILPGEVYDPGSVTGRSGTPRKAYAQQRFSVEVRGTDDLWETDVNAVDNARLSLVPSMASNLPQTLAMSGGVRTFPNLYISDPGVGVVLKATHPTNGAIFAGYSSGFDVLAVSSPTLTINIPPGSNKVTLSGGISGTAADQVSVSCVTVAIQDKGNSRYWNGASFLSVPRQWFFATLSDPEAPSTNWNLPFSDADLTPGTQYFVSVLSTNTAIAAGVVETTFTFTTLTGAVGDGEGSAVLSSNSVTGCQVITSTIGFLAGPWGIDAGGKIALHVPDGWTRPEGAAAVDQPLPSLPPPGTFYIQSPVAYSLELNPPKSGFSVLGDNWVLYTPVAPLASGQWVYFVYTGFPPGGAVAQKPHGFKVLVQGSSSGNLVSISTSPVMAPLAAGPPARLAFSPEDPIALGSLQSAPTMQIVLADACGAPTTTGVAFDASLSAGQSLVLDPSATFYASAGGKIGSVNFGVGARVASPSFYFKTSTTGVDFEMLMATATIPGFGRNAAYKFVKMLSSSVTISGVSVDTGTLMAGARTATMTGTGFDHPGFINFKLSQWDARWEVRVSTDPLLYESPVFMRSGTGDPGRTLAWNWINERIYPPQAALPFEYFVRISVEGGVVEDTTTRLYIDRSASILGSLGADGAGAYVYATGPGTNYGNFDQADGNGDFRVYGLENGKAYNIAASTQVKTGQNQFLTLAVSSVNVTATNSGANIGVLSLPVPGNLRVSVSIPVSAPKELWGFIRAQNSDLTRSGIGTIHYTTGTASSDDGAKGFGGTASTWTVMGLPPGTYDLDVEVSGLGLSTRVAGIVVNPGARTDLAMSLQKRANVYGLAVLPTTSTFGTWVSVQAIKFGEKYPALSGGSFVPGVSAGVNPTSSTFALYGLDPGSWTVQAMAPGFVAGSSQVLVSGSADIGDHLPGSFDLKLTSAGVITGTVTVTGNSLTAYGLPDDPGDAFSVFVNAYNPATFSRASIRVRLARKAVVTSSTFTIAGLENGSWVLTSRMQGFTDGRQAVTVTAGSGRADLKMAANDARLVATVLVPGGPHPPAEFSKVSLMVRGPAGAYMLGDITAGTTVQYTVTGVVWQSSPMAPGNYILEAAYAGNGAQRRVEIPLTEKSTAYATLDLTGQTYSVSGVASLMGNVQFSSSSYAVSVSSIPGLLNAAQTTSYCLLGSALPVNISAVHMELLPIDSKTGEYLNGPLQRSTSTTGSCRLVDLGSGLGLNAANPLRGYLASISTSGSFSFNAVSPGAYVLRNNAELDLDPGNGNELPQVSRIFSVLASTTLAVFKLETGFSVSGTIFLPPQTVMSRTVGVELLDNAANRVRKTAVSFNNSNAASYLFEKLPDGLYSIAVQDLDVPRSFGAMPKSVKVAAASLTGEDIRLSRTGIIKGKIALQSRLADGATGPFLLVSNNNLHLLPSGFKVEAKANPWFQGGYRAAKGRLCGPTGCSVLELDANDQFIVEDLLPGTYDLKLWAQNLAESLLNGGMALIPAVLPAVKGEEGRLIDVGTVNVLSAVQLRGTVRDSSGSPLSNIRVAARASKREGGREQEAESYSMTDQNGAYTLQGIDPVVRYYDVFAAMRSEIETAGAFVPPYEQNVSLSVDVSCTTSLDFALLSAPYSISGQVTASGGPGLSVQFGQGQTVPGAKVFVQRDGVIPTKNPVADISVFTDPKGNFTVPALAGGTYRLTIASLNYGSRAMLVTVKKTSVDVGQIALSPGATLSGSIKKPDGSAPSQDEVRMIVASNDDMSDIVFGTLVKDENSKTVGDYSISGFKAGVAYTVVLVDLRENLVTPREARYLVFASSSESRGLDLVYRTPKPKVFSKARREGREFKVDMAMTHPLRRKKVSDDDYAAILTTYAALGTLSDFELSNDRTRLSAVYTPEVNESSFTLLLRGYSSVPDPDSLEAEDNEFELSSVATFYAGIDGMHQNGVGNVWGGNLLIEGDQGRVTLPSGAFDADVSSSVQVALNISSESLTRFGVSGMGAGRAMRFAPSAYPAEVMRAMEAVPPQVSPFSAFYNVMLPLGLRTSLSKPAQLTVTYSSGTDPSTLNLYWYNPAANNYILQQDVTGAAPVIDEVNRTITINVNHFSTFVLFHAGVSVITGDAFTGTDIEVFNFPNPFDLEPKAVTTIHPAGNQVVRGTMIRFSLSSAVSGDGTIRIYGVTGELIRKLDLGFLAGGKHYYQNWDGRNDSGRDVGSGVYIGVLRVGKKVNTFRMAVIR